MSQLEKIEELLMQLSEEDKVKLMQWLASELTGTYPGIDKSVDVCGGSARISRTRIPVWSLVISKDSGLTNDDILKEYPSLSMGDLINAWNYYNAHKEEIEKDIDENQLADP